MNFEAFLLKYLQFQVIQLYYCLQTAVKFYQIAKIMYFSLSLCMIIISLNFHERTIEAKHKEHNKLVVVIGPMKDSYY